MNDQELAQILASDPNMMPYFVVDVQTEVAVPVKFQQIAVTDKDELQGSEWQKAKYADVWPSYLSEERTLKLIITSEEDSTIQGMVRMGQVAPGSRFLRKNLLESAPRNGYSAPNRRYRGVGRVLVARLVVESYLAQQQGRVIVTLGASTNRQFYIALGFVKQATGERTYAIFETAALELLQSVLLKP